MPCFRCGTRQTDPARGASPWRRAVVGGHQVLVCPACQTAAGLDDLLDRCGSCGSARLAKALGETTCRACGRHGVAARTQASTQVPTEVPTATDDATLADEVAEAVRRVLGDRG